MSKKNAKRIPEKKQTKDYTKYEVTNFFPDSSFKTPNVVWRSHFEAALIWQVRIYISHFHLPQRQVIKKSNFPNQKTW